MERKRLEAQAFAAGIQGIKQGGITWSALSMPKNSSSFKKTTRFSCYSCSKACAFSVLEEIRCHKVFLEQAWNRGAKEPLSLPPAEKAFARLLTTEVVSLGGVALDILINRVLKSPDDIQDDVRNALRISFVELFSYLNKPAHVVYT